MKRLLFSRVNVEIFEDEDYPGDPAPYLTIDAGADGLPLALELEEARDLARAIRQWIRDVEAKELRVTQELERERAELLERRRRQLRNAEVAGYQRQTVTTVDILQMARQLRRTGTD